jgi:urease accessory protein
VISVQQAPEGAAAMARMQRATGELRVTVKSTPTGTALDDLRQAGCLKARFPRRIDSGWLDAVMLNTGGGVAGGDRLDVAIGAGPGARATVAAQAAERIYRAVDAPSRVRTVLTVADGAALEWLPQETILFDRFSLDRRLQVDIAPGARFLGVETLVFGRAAMGETVRQGRLRDLIRVRRGGELLLHDAIRLDGAIDAILARPATGGGARVISTLVCVAPDAGGFLDPVRDALGHAEAGASAWNGMLVARVLGRDSAEVRHTVIAALNVLRASRPLPRVWLC